MGPLHKKNGQRKQLTPEVGYEADEEASTTGTSDMSTQSPAPADSSLYDFDESDSEMQISPMPLKGKKAKAKKASTTRAKSVSADKKQNKAETNVRKGKTTATGNKSTKILSAENKKTEVKIPKTKTNVMKKTSKQNQENTPINVKTQNKSVDISMMHLSRESPIFSKTPVVNIQRLDLSNVDGYESFQRRLRKRKCETPKDQAIPNIPKILKPSPSVKNATTSGKRQSRKRDSGVLLSPPSLHKIPPPATKDTSTPSNMRAPRGRPKQAEPSLLNESCFGFDSVSFAADSSLQMSPVKTKVLPPLTPLSDYVSMDSMQISCDDIIRRQSFENDADVPELFSMEQDDFSLNRSTTKSYKSTSSKRRPKKAVSTTLSKPAVMKKSKADNMAEKFNTEFDEIEKFELSIEDM